MNTDRYNFKESADEAKSVLEKLGYDHLDPVQLRRAFLLLTRACFSSVDWYGMSDDLNYPPVIYSDNPKKRKVDVELDYLYDAEKVAEEPAVYVGLGDIAFKRLGVGDVSRRSQDNSHTTYTNQSDLQLHLRHVSPAADMSYLLANHSAGFFLAMKVLLLNNVPGLADIRLENISKVNLTQVEKSRSFRTDVIIGLTVMFSWTTTSEDHRLKDVVVKQTASTTTPGSC